jgi:hypothetical protein
MSLVKSSNHGLNLIEVKSTKTKSKETTREYRNKAFTTQQRPWVRSKKGKGKGKGKKE